MTGPVQDVSTSAGVTRIDLLAGRQVGETAQDLVRRWAEDRALPGAVRGQLLMLVDAAIEHGIALDPRGLTLTLRWLDADHVRLDFRWLGGSDIADPYADPELEATTATIETFAVDWGFEVSRLGPIHWMVLDTRWPDRPAQPTQATQSFGQPTPVIGRSRSLTKDT